RNEVYEAYSDHAKARDILGAEARVTLSEGLKHMALWAKTHGARKSKKFKNIEVPIHLPPSWRS
ncbi:MAG: UDP-glucose 4-epimerase, partial [Candidatus Omnitrophica bacterium]|nr:UDP-glucose 4-epimerase [Candidatus Omnitrophota bacterium]